MKNIFRLLALTLALITVTLAFSSCHGGNDINAFALPEKFDSSREYEISFWAKNDSNMTQVDIYRKAISDFEALYPNIKVNLKLYTNYNDIYKDVITNIPTATTPNVCITYPDHIATYMTGKNVIVPLRDLMEDKNYGLGGKELLFDSPTEKEIIKKFLDEGKIGGVQYALPFMRSTEACYVNRTAVERLGYELPEKLTWDFIWEVSEAATKKDANGVYVANGQTTMIPFIYKSTDNMMIQLLAQHGAGYSDDVGNVKIFNDTTKQLLYEVAEHSGSGAFGTFARYSYPANSFNKEQCIFMIDSTAGATWVGPDSPQSDIHGFEHIDFDIEVMEIPQVDVNDPKMISQGPSVCLFNKEDQQEVIASWLFMQFLLTNDVQISYSQTEGYAPVTSKAQNSTQYIDYLDRAGEDNDLYYDIKIKATKLLLNNTENTFVTPVFNGSASLRNAAGELIEESASAPRRKKEVNEEFFEKTYQKIRSLYHLDEINVDASAAKREMGALPKESVALISILVSVWALIIAFVLVDFLKKRKKSKKH